MAELLLTFENRAALVDEFDKNLVHGRAFVANASGLSVFSACTLTIEHPDTKRRESFGCEVVDLTKSASLSEQIEQILGVPEVDCAIDCVGFEAHGTGKEAGVERPATVLNQVMEVARAGGGIGIPGLYVTGDPGAVDDNAKIGMLGIRIGLGWAKSHSFHTGQCPVMKYNRPLMQCILHDKIKIAKAVNVTVISLDEAVQIGRAHV